MDSFLRHWSIKHIAFMPIAILGTLGGIFVGLDVVDIVEIYNLPLPVNILNTLFISSFAISVAYITGRYAATSTSTWAFWLGCGFLVFGTGSLFYGWLPNDELNTRISIHEGAALIASLFHITGAVMEILKPRHQGLASLRKPKIVFASYLIIIISISGVALLAHQGIIPEFYLPERESIVREVVRLVTLVLFFLSSILYLKSYLKSQLIFFFWYSLGLMLFTLGFFLISLSAVEGLIAWLGRLAQYFGGMYFLVAAFLVSHKMRNVG